ncbi:MAG: transglutaminase domain-containing protein [Candidatus Eremiobacteraeota bacterium]|nr:transglutaminase domain-containing protein [Candidatus Eremiobacteraeota bacterium]
MNKFHRTAEKGQASLIIIELMLLMIIFACIPPGEAGLQRRPPEAGETFRSHLTLMVTIQNMSSSEKVKGHLLLPLPSSYAPFQQVEHLESRPCPCFVTALEDNRPAGVYEVRLDPGAEEKILLSFDAAAASVRIPLSEASSRRDSRPPEALYLRPDGEVRPDIQAIRALALSAVEGERNPYYRMVKIYDYMRKNFTFREGNMRRSLEEILKDRTVQCSDAIILFVSLCRAAEIPARIVGGLYISHEKVYFPQTHSWAEVYLQGPGWVPVDPTLGRFDNRSRLLSLGGRNCFYLQLFSNQADLGVFTAEGGQGAIPRMRVQMALSSAYLEHRKKGRSIGLVPATSGRASPARFREECCPAAMKAYERGLTLYRQGKRNDAYPELQAAANDSPRFIRAHRQLITCAFELSRGRSLSRHYEAMASADPSSVYARYYQGLCALHMEHYGRAEDLLLGCEKDGLVSSDIYHSIAYLYLSTGQLERGESYASRALGAEGDHFPVLVNLLSMLQDAEEWEKVVYWSKKGLVEYPGNFLLMGQAGYGLIMQGKPSEALYFLEGAAQKEPSMGWFHALIGWAYRDLGDRERARECLEKGLALRKGIADDRFYRNMLEELRK